MYVFSYLWIVYHYALCRSLDECVHPAHSLCTRFTGQITATRTSRFGS